MTSVDCEKFIWSKKFRAPLCLINHIIQVIQVHVSFFFWDENPVWVKIGRRYLPYACRWSAPFVDILKICKEINGTIRIYIYMYHIPPKEIMNIRNRKIKALNAQFHLLNLMTTSLSTHLPNSFGLPRASVSLVPRWKRSGDYYSALFSIPPLNPEACSGIPVQVTRWRP